MPFSRFVVAMMVNESLSQSSIRKGSILTVSFSKRDPLQIVILEETLRTNKKKEKKKQIKNEIHQIFSATISCRVGLSSVRYLGGEYLIDFFFLFSPISSVFPVCSLCLLYDR